MTEDGWFASPLPPDRTNVSGIDGEWRLAITGTDGERPVASIYLADTRRSEPAAFHFLLEPDQRLPRIPYGGLVQARGVVARGERPTFFADGVEIHPASDLKRGGGTLMEGGTNVVHPAVGGAHPRRGFVESHSFDSVEEWDQFLHRELRTAVIWLVVTVVVTLARLAWLIYLIVRGHSGGGGGGGGGGGLGAIGLVGSLALVIRARRSLSDARELVDMPAEPMFMDLWWSAGHGHGPIAIASIGPTLADHDELRVPVIGVPEDLIDANEVLPVLVHGRTTDAPLIEVRGHLLWPADNARTHSPKGWTRMKRRQRPARAESSGSSANSA